MLADFEMTMKLDQLETFITIVETGALNLTAEKLNKTQPAISMTIRRLEKYIGFDLFDRNNYRLTLTDKGLIYYQKAKVILDRVKQLRSFSTSINNGEEHKITIAIEDIASSESLWDLIKPVQLEFPNTELVLQTESRLQSIKRLAAEEVQLAITPWLVSFDNEGAFDSKVIGSMNHYFCIHKDLLLPFNIDHENEININVLMNLPQIVPTEFAIKLNYDEFLKPIGNNIVRVNSLVGMMSALKAKLGWGLIIDSYWNESMSNHFYKFSIDNNAPPLSYEIRIVKNKFYTLGPAAEKLWFSFK